MMLVGLERLACGCVAGVYHARPASMELEFVEAKGPHCPYAGHRADGISRLGFADLIGSEDEPSA